MRGLLFLLAVQSIFAIRLHDDPESSGMRLAISAPEEQDPSVNQPLEVKSVPDSLAMKGSSVPEDDLQGEDGQVMAYHSEDALDIGGSGEAMQLSGPALPTVTAEDRQFDIDEEEPRLSEDMAEGAAALDGIIDARQAKLSDYRQMISDSKNDLESRSRDAKRLIQDAYSKQAYLHDLQKQVMEQFAALEAQKQSVAAKEAELATLKQRLEHEATSINQQTNVQTAQGGVADAIQSQMASLQAKQKAFEEETAAKQQQLAEMEASLLKMKTSVDEKDASLAKKDAEITKMYSDLSEVSKKADSHEQHVKEAEMAVQKHQDEMNAREAALEAKVNELTSKLTMMRQEEIAGTQNALQTEASLDKSIDELPAEAKRVLGVHDDLTMESQVKSQPPVPVKRQAVLVVPNPPPSNDETPDLVDRSTRDVETRMDERPATYGQKNLVGQTYAAKFEPKPNGDMRDADGKCRNSRGEIMSCDTYSLSNNGANLPAIVPSIGDLLDGDYMVDSGPCVLKCGYHKGVGRALQYVSIEIPSKTVHNQTIGCPKANNGFPFVSCLLLVDDTEQCRSTCVFDGSANPLKPQMMGVGASAGQKFNAEDFRSLAHTTYTKQTSTGCASRMAADPLVACEVRL